MLESTDSTLKISPWEVKTVRNPLTTFNFMLKTIVRVIPIVVMLGLLGGCGGGGTGKTTTITIPPPGEPPPNPSASPTAASSFGMQCGQGDTRDCEGTGATTPIVWPTTQAQPGMLRLHDAGTYWSLLEPQNGTFDWTNLDEWLDLIAQHEPVDVIQVFTWVPCWDSSQGTCGIDPTALTGTNGLPRDLAPSGSPSFDIFVTNFVQHCSSAGNCVKDIIKYYEMWNEWDLTFHVVGPINSSDTVIEDVYNMVAPAAKIIKSNVPSAIILSPSATPDAVGLASNTGLPWQCSFQSWLNYESAHGQISDWVAWHVYLNATSTTTNIPEVQWTEYNNFFLEVQDGGTLSNCSGPAVSGWSTIPWADTETNFGSNALQYECPSAQYTQADCAGQIVRWQLLHASNGGSSVDWYKWNQTIGGVPQYETDYYYMMKYLEGGKFPSGPCAGTGTLWTCNFTEANGATALWVWTTSESGGTYSVPSGFKDYRDLSGNTTNVSSGQSINITVEPVMLEN